MYMFVTLLGFWASQFLVVSALDMRAYVKDSVEQRAVFMFDGDDIEFKIEYEILTVGLIGAIFAMATAIAAFAFRVAPATGARVLWAGQWWIQWMTRGMQMAVALIAAVNTIDIPVAQY